MGSRGSPCTGRSGWPARYHRRSWVGRGAHRAGRRSSSSASATPTREPQRGCARSRTTDAFQLLLATILSAQCTDERVNLVTPALFARYPSPEDLAGAEPSELEEIIRSTGFFRAKAASLIGMAGALVERFD